MFPDIYKQHGWHHLVNLSCQKIQIEGICKKTKLTALKMMTYFLGIATAPELDFLNKSKQGLLGTTKPSIQTKIGVGSSDKSSQILMFHLKNSKPTQLIHILWN
mmetsp:Transcript_47423/g.92542  ORF Transcript_47423/g.92542 Transcript_47423/m.92542 type:complete len:104 (-) Transcript_47423:251-562(-)